MLGSAVYDTECRSLANKSIVQQGDFLRGHSQPLKSGAPGVALGAAVCRTQVYRGGGV